MSPSIESLSHPSSGLLARIAGFGAAIGRAAIRVGNALRHRHEVMRLLELDDRSLKDIGLLRSDVIGALASPYGEDPSVWLRLRAVEQRASRRRLAARPRTRGRSPQMA